VLIEFFDPPLELSLGDSIKLSAALKECSSCAGVCIALGKEFFECGIDDIDSNIMPLIKRSAKNVHPRILLSYSILLWFCLEVSLICVFHHARVIIHSLGTGNAQQSCVVLKNSASPVQFNLILPV
jgi:hypothetical protein